ncbi:MAG: hypothetical protein JRG91_03570 [Deltaproteobacteria bacterium]|nr:hypothetical protein [Deltaproteobacteria bacterium]
MALKDDDTGLRKLTLRFFREGLLTFERLKDDMDNFPDSEDALGEWICELSRYSGRAQDLCERWRKLHPTIELPADPDPVNVRREQRQTPFDLPTPNRGS